MNRFKGWELKSWVFGVSSGAEAVSGHRERSPEAARALQRRGGREAAESCCRNSRHADSWAAWALRPYPWNGKHPSISSALSHVTVTHTSILSHMTPCYPLFPDNPLARDCTSAVAQWNNWPASSWSGHSSQHDAGREKSRWDAHGEWSSWDSFRLGKGRRGDAGSCF